MLAGVVGDGDARLQAHDADVAGTALHAEHLRGVRRGHPSRSASRAAEAMTAHTVSSAREAASACGMPRECRPWERAPAKAG